MATIVELRNRMLGYYEKIDWEDANHRDKLKLDAEYNPLLNGYC